jgi:glycosyltransferase involved in cell wall biosynthesis
MAAVNCKRKSPRYGSLMRVLWISHSADIGGAELGLAEAVEALARRGHESIVVLPREGQLRDRLTAASEVKICPHNLWSTNRSQPISTAARWLLYDVLVAQRKIVELARATQVDVVATNTISAPTGALAAWRAGLPHVWIIREFGKLDHGGKFLLGERLTMRMIDALSDRVLVHSEALRKYFARWFAASKLQLVTYAVSVPRARREDSDTDRPLRLVLIGQRSVSKGQRDAVLAVGVLAAAGVRVELDLVGRADAKYEEMLRRLARAAGVAGHVRFLPFDTDPFSVVARADVALMCSRSEAFGRITVEALKLGKPVIGAAGGATPELVRHGWNGFLYPPGNATALADCIRLLGQDRGRAKEMGRRGQAWARETFTLDACGNDLEAALDEVVRRSGSRKRAIHSRASAS